MNNNQVNYKIIIRLGILCFAIFIISILSVIGAGMNINKGIAIVVSLILIVIFTILWFKSKKQKNLQRHR